MAASSSSAGVGLHDIARTQGQDTAAATAAALGQQGAGSSGGTGTGPDKDEESVVQRLFDYGRVGVASDEQVYKRHARGCADPDYDAKLRLGCVGRLVGLNPADPKSIEYMDIELARMLLGDPSNLMFWIDVQNKCREAIAEHAVTPVRLVSLIKFVLTEYKNPSRLVSDHEVREQLKHRPEHIRDALRAIDQQISTPTRSEPIGRCCERCGLEIDVENARGLAFRQPVYDDALHASSGDCAALATPLNRAIMLDDLSAFWSALGVAGTVPLPVSIEQAKTCLAKAGVRPKFDDKQWEGKLSPLTLAVHLLHETDAICDMRKRWRLGIIIAVLLSTELGRPNDPRCIVPPMTLLRRRYAAVASMSWDPTGATPLMVACYGGWPFAISLLLEALGPDADPLAARESDGFTALHAACSQQAHDIHRFPTIHVAMVPGTQGHQIQQGGHGADAVLTLLEKIPRALSMVTRVRPALPTPAELAINARLLSVLQALITATVTTPKQRAELGALLVAAHRVDTAADAGPLFVGVLLTFGANPLLAASDPARMQLVADIWASRLPLLVQRDVLAYVTDAFRKLAKPIDRSTKPLVDRILEQAFQAVAK